MKLSDLTPGDRVRITSPHWGCVPQGATRVVRRDAEGFLYVKCREGGHGLVGQLGDGDELAGLEWANTPGGPP